MHTANTPQKQAYANTLPAKKVVSNQYQGKVVYLVCTDPGSKQCYVGDEAAYQRYKQTAIQQSISEDQHKISDTRSTPRPCRCGRIPRARVDGFIVSRGA